MRWHATGPKRMRRQALPRAGLPTPPIVGPRGTRGLARRSTLVLLLAALAICGVAGLAAVVLTGRTSETAMVAAEIVPTEPPTARFAPTDAGLAPTATELPASIVPSPTDEAPVLAPGTRGPPPTHSAPTVTATLVKDTPPPTAEPAATATSAPSGQDETDGEAESAPVEEAPPPPPTSAPRPAPRPAPAPTRRTYTVQRGDELKQIAARYGVSMASIMAINSIPNPDSLRVGQVLVIPSP